MATNDTMISIPPRIIKGGLVLLDPAGGAVQRIIVLQYNPDTLTRTLQAQGVGGEGGQRSDVLRLKAPPVETIHVEAEIDATDQLEIDEGTARQVGIFPQLAALETIIYPTVAQLQSVDAQVAQGTLEVAPVEGPLVLFVWSAQRILPVLITEFSITEEAFDTALNPIRAKVTLGLRVLSTNDLPSGHRGGSLFMTYLRNKERLRGQAGNGNLKQLGITGIP